MGTPVIPAAQSELVENEITQRTTKRKVLRYSYAIGLGIVCEVYFGWTAVFIGAAIYALLDAITIAWMHIKISRMKLGYAATIGEPLTTEQHYEIIGAGISKGVILGLAQFLIIGLTVSALASITKYITSLFL